MKLMPERLPARDIPQPVKWEEVQMRFTRRYVLVAAFLPLVATPVTAQRWTWDLGVNGGYSMFTKALGAEETGLAEDAAGSSVTFAPGLMFGGQLGYWFAPNLGGRLNARYAKRDIEGNDLDVALFEGVTLLGGTIDLLYRFGAPSSEYQGTEMLPYITGGVGFKRFSTDGTATCTFETETTDCAPFTTGTQSFALQEGATLAGLVGLGADFRIAPNVAIRAEINDQIFKPQIKPGTLAGGDFTITDDESASKFVHEFGVQVGLHYLFGPSRTTVAAAETLPPPSGPPAAAGPPAQAPPTTPLTPAGGVAGATEEAVTVCVIDPTTSGGIRVEQGTFVPATGDTLVTVNGQRVSLSNVKGSVVVAADAPWYVRGAPLVLTVGTRRFELVTTGSPRVATPSELAFLGTINGLPVYANAVEVQGVSAELAELNRAQPGVEFGKLLNEHKDIHARLAAVKTYYVPLQPTGCVFQTLQLQDQIRKKQDQQ
jgi:outer membrane protein with beta-barrel domain